MDGLEECRADGDAEWVMEGEPEGILLGLGDGMALIDGLTEWVTVGACVGFLLGLQEGMALVDGLCEGNFDGMLEAVSLGLEEGTAEGGKELNLDGAVLGWLDGGELAATPFNRSNGHAGKGSISELYVTPPYIVRSGMRTMESSVGLTAFR